MCVYTFRENSAADKSEILTNNNIPSSHIAPETVVLATEQNHLAAASRAVDSLPARGLLIVVICFWHIFDDYEYISVNVLELCS